MTSTTVRTKVYVLFVTAVTVLSAVIASPAFATTIGSGTVTGG